MTHLHRFVKALMHDADLHFKTACSEAREDRRAHHQREHRRIKEAIDTMVLGATFEAISERVANLRRRAGR